MHDGLLTANLLDLWKSEFTLCKVKEGETVIIYTEPEFQYPHYIGAAVAAAKLLGADCYVMTAPSTDTFYNKSIQGAWKAADMVVTLTRVPFIYSKAHNEILATGTRVLLAQDSAANMRRLFPHEDVVKRTYAGAKRMAAANMIRVTDNGGSDFTFRKEGRKGHAQVGYCDRPGQWDNWPSGMVACAPHEDSGEGTYVIAPGDIIETFKRIVRTPITLTLREGVVTKIEGGPDAAVLRDALAAFNDPNAYKWSHAGWGTEHRADWNNLGGMDIEAKYANVMVSLGINIYDSPDEHSGIGGTNDTACHIDICCRNKNFYLDDELIVSSDEEIGVPELQ